ncbi:uncharacterized protein B0H18DRAFT_1214228 [Fomitopsis serialis]|uniref:uncharacterized protein n=1 Tax=Fomitopsis serialis TaxID=139415 RepID=UPI002007FDCF|nr:uncharacterized protein B0H18DRAFT_1214228 [Neoantrodia serialis]KAH9918317.1 hypothetical protein B0H18DRAFT_1214228 [Neoantrodia serialis]
MLVKFVSSWCAHCIELAPAFNKAAASLKGVAKLAMFDCSDHTQFDFCKSISIRSFPTLPVYWYGTFAAYPESFDRRRDLSGLKASAPRRCRAPQLRGRRSTGRRSSLVRTYGRRGLTLKGSAWPPMR